jgi:hypothetical protein
MADSLYNVPKTLTPNFEIEMTPEFMEEVKDAIEAEGQSTTGIDLVKVLKGCWTKIYDAIVDENE